MLRAGAGTNITQPATIPSSALAPAATAAATAAVAAAAAAAPTPRHYYESYGLHASANLINGGIADTVDDVEVR